METFSTPDFRTDPIIQAELPAEFSSLRVAGRFLQGTLHGFTTININRTEPQNVAEGLAQSLGTWVGITGSFVGGPVSWGAKLLSRGAAQGLRLNQGIKAVRNFKSVPIYIGDKALEGLKYASRHALTPQGRQFIQKHRIGADNIEGALRIGTAMSTLGWQEGINGMLTGAAFGAFFGGTDRLIGNAIRNKRPMIQSLLKSNDKARVKRAEKIVSSISAGIVSGMPSTLMGQPWEYQVYDYLFGAWLGAEPSFAHRRASQFIHAARLKNQEIELMSPKAIKEYQPYKDLMENTKSARLRREINEEIETQVLYRFGQMAASGDATRATFLIAMAAQSNNPDIYKSTLQEVADGSFVNERLEALKQDALAQGMQEPAAENYAIERVRDEYVDWKRGALDPNESIVLRDTLDEFKPGSTEHALYQPLRVGEDVGIATKIGERGEVIEVTAPDGAKLVYPKGDKGVIATEQQLANQRENLRTNYTSMTKDEFVALVAAAKANQDEVSIPLQLWNMFPDVKESNRVIGIEKDGDVYKANYRLGGEKVELDGEFSSATAAYTSALSKVRAENALLEMRRNPNLLRESEALRVLSELYDDLNMTVSSRPVLDIIKEIASEYIRSNKLTSTEQALAPVRVYRKISQMAESTMGRVTPQMRKLWREVVKADRDGDINRHERALLNLYEYRDSYGYKGGWKGFTEKLRNMYKGVDFSEDRTTMKGLRQWYRRTEKEELVQQLVLDVTGKSNDIQLKIFDTILPDGKRNIQYMAPSFLHRTLKKLVGTEDASIIHISKSLILDGKRIKSGDLTDTNLKFDDQNIINRLNQELKRNFERGEIDREYFIASGLKDKDTLRALPYLFKTRKNAMDYLEKRVRGLDKIKPGFKEDFRKAYKESGQDPDWLRQYATMMRVWEGLNNDITGEYRTPIEFLAAKSGFIDSVAAFNKRLQIMDADGMTADPAFYSTVDASGNEVPRAHLNAIVVNTLNKSSQDALRSQAEGVLEDMFVNSTGESQRADQQRDGAVIMSQREFDAMLRDGGIETMSSAIKGVTAFTDKHGMFLGKYAIFRARDEVDTFMKDNNTQLLYYTSTTKQLGDRASYDMQVKQDGRVEFYRDNKTVTPEKYLIPIEGMTINHGVSESLTSALKNQKIAVQVLQSLSPHLIDSQIASQTIAETMTESLRSSEANIRLLSEMEAFAMAQFDGQIAASKLDDLAKRVEKMNMDDLGPRDIARVLNGDHIYVKTGLYGKMIRHLHSNQQNEITELTRDDFIDDGIKELKKEYASDMDVLLMNMDDAMLTPEVINSKQLRPYVDAVYRKQMYRRVFTPKVKYSAKSIASQQDGWYLKNHGPIKDGTFVLGMAGREMNVRVGDESTKLGKAWDELQIIPGMIKVARQQVNETEAMLRATKENSKKFKELEIENARNIARLNELMKRRSSLQDAMTMVIARVPIEHVSGVRAMEFVGFTSERGMTSKFNPNDMAYLGGMDLDIDSVFIYQNLGKKYYKGKDGKERRLVDELNKESNKWHWNRDKGDGKKRFLDPKSEEMQAVFKAEYDKTKRYADMFNPKKVIEGGRASQKGNASLGIIVNARRDLHAMLAQVQSERIFKEDLTPKQQKIFEKAFGRKKTYVIMEKVHNAEAIVDEIARAGINMSADASDLVSFIDATALTSLMHSKAYKLKDTFQKGFKNPDVLLSILHGKSRTHQYLRESTQIVHGTSGDVTNMNLQMTISELINKGEQIRAHTTTSAVTAKGDGIDFSDLPGSWYASMKNMSELPISFAELSQLNESNIEAVYNAFNSIFSDGGQLGQTINEIMFFRRSGEKVATSPKTGKPYTREVPIGTLKKTIAEFGTIYKGYREGTKTITEVHQAYGKMIDYMSENYMEMASVINIYREAARILDQKKVFWNGRENVPVKLWHIQNVLAKVSKLKMNHFALKGIGRYTMERQTYKSIEALQAAVSDYKSSLSKEFHKLVDFAGISNLRIHTTPAESTTDNPFLHNASSQNIKDFFNTFSALRRLQFTNDEQLSLETINRLFADDADPTSVLFETIPLTAEILPRVDLRVKEVSAKDEAFKKVKYTDEETSSSIIEDATQNDLTRFEAQTKALFKQMREAGENMNLSKEEQLLVNDLREFMDRYPVVKIYFDRIFEGVQAYDVEMGIARDYRMATMEDLRMFVNTLKSTKHGNLLQDSEVHAKLPKWMYWLTPDRHHRHYAKHDLQFQERTARVLTPDGIVDKKVMTLSSISNNLQTKANMMQHAIEIRRREVNDVLLNTLGNLSNQFGKDYDALYRYTVHEREVRSIKEASEYTMAQRNKYLKEVKDKTFIYNGKEIGLKEAYQAFDQAITSMNKYIYENMITSKVDDTFMYRDKDKKFIDTDYALARLTEIMSEQTVNPKLPSINFLNRLAVQIRIQDAIKEQFPLEVNDPAFTETVINFTNGELAKRGMSIEPKDYGSYYPHRDFTKEALRQRAFDEYKRKKDASALGKVQKQAFDSMPIKEDEAGFFIFKEELKLNITPSKTTTSGNLKHREAKERQLPGWDSGTNAYFNYVNDLLKVQYNKALALVGDKEIRNFELRVGADNANPEFKSWANFMRLYLSDQVGLSTMIPKYLVNDKNMSLQDSGYYYFTDSYFTDLDRRISKKLGTRPLLRDNNPERTYMLRDIANMEAKYALISLLSRPKAFITNKYGGATLLAATSGISDAMKGLSLTQIQRVNPHIKTMDDAIVFAEQQGAMESVIRHEVMEQAAWKNANYRKAFEHMLMKIKRDPAVKDETLFEIGRKHGLNDKVMNVAAWPMRKSERILRTRSFLAHYIKAIDTLEVSGINAHEHPWALEMARRGVTTAQFLYNNANRPAFARSNVGKIFARFKLWAINSVKVRLDAFNDFQKLHVDPYTGAESYRPEFRKFENLLMADMFMLALASLFPFHVMGNAVPEPYGWMSDLLDWAFGDPNEKRGAFRQGAGLPVVAAPLAVALPPSSRLLTTWIEPVMTGDWEAYMSYQMYTHFPFGLFVRDVKNAAKNPAMAIDRMTGMPVGEILTSL